MNPTLALSSVLYSDFEILLYAAGWQRVSAFEDEAGWQSMFNKAQAFIMVTASKPPFPHERPDYQQVPGVKLWRIACHESTTVSDAMFMLEKMAKPAPGIGDPLEENVGRSARHELAKELGWEK